MTENPVHLRRVLGLWDLIFYGIVLIQPIAPVGIFGVAAGISRGHVPTTLVIAMFAMMLTAYSYGRMSILYPAAGSAYTYVGRGLNLHLGFLTGWVMILDYLVIPVINVIYLALTIQRLVPEIPYVVWVAVTAVVMTFLNIQRVRFTARTNEAMLAIMSAVILVFVVLAVRYLFRSAGWTGLFVSRPFYDPATFNLQSIATATSLAALTYIGFDGVTTLAEEVKDPKRNVPRATVLVCLFTGLLSTLEIYLAQCVWPDYTTFSNPETAFLDVCGRIGGSLLFQAMAAILIVACLGSGLAGQVGAARLLYGMGRDGVIPPIFAKLGIRSGIPVWNVVFIGVLTLAGAILVSYERAVALLNFGAFLAFMGVNLSTMRRYYFDVPAGQRKLWSSFLVPGAGFLFCAAIWIFLPVPAKIAGGGWLLVGIIYQAAKTRGFRLQPPAVDFNEG
jgi:amino acid transporter